LGMGFGKIKRITKGNKGMKILEEDSK